MLLLLLACAPDPWNTVPTPDVEGVGAPSATVILSASVDARDPLLVELDATGAIIWQFHIKDLFETGSEEAALLPGLMDVQPVAGGTLLLAFFDLGILEIDRDGNVVWRHDDPTVSHDVDRLPNGNTIYTRTWAKQGEAAIIEVDPEGNEVWSWSGVEAFGSNPLFDGYVDEGDAWMHANAVQRLADGRTSVCVRNFNEIVLVNPDGSVSREITFASPENSEGPNTTGALQGVRPHGAEWVPVKGLSVALRAPDRALRIKDGTTVQEFRSPAVTGITDVDHLPDGSMLIAAHTTVQEYDAAGDLVWSWSAPPQSGPTADLTDDRLRHVFYTVSRIDADGAPLDFD